MGTSSTQQLRPIPLLEWPVLCRRALSASLFGAQVVTALRLRSVLSPLFWGNARISETSASASLQVDLMGVRDADVDASEITATTVFALGALVGAGMTCVVIVLNGHMSVPVSRSARTSTTISNAAAAAWQVLRRPDSTEPAEPQAEIATIRPRAPLSVQTVPPPLDGVSLTRALQRELKKIGCCRGDINGVWTSATRKAMKAFRCSRPKAHRAALA
jgi:hypothetical protein